jgi:hypothetical protein
MKIPISILTYSLTYLLLCASSWVHAYPQDGGWDVAVGRDHVRKLPQNRNSPSNPSTTSPPPSPALASAGKMGAHIMNPRHRPTCDMSLTDEQVCAAGEACVQDPFVLNKRLVMGENDYTIRRGICTPNIRSNMCGGFAGAARKCSNDAGGWKCAKPARCDRENIADCDWLCVRPPPTSIVAGKGFGY